jgi:hypothetical protein
MSKMISIASCSRLAVATICLAASCAFASDVYKWVDEDGNVHYGDRPAAGSERMDIVSRPTDPAAIRARRDKAEVTEPSAAPAEEAAAPADDKRPTRAERNQQRREKAEKCAEAREKLQGHLVARRMYRTDESGERVYLDDAEIQAAKERAQQKVDELCSP